MKAAKRFFSVQSNIKSNPIIEMPDQFKIMLNTDQFAFITYQKLSDDVYDLLHSSIPEQFQGKGLGGILGQVWNQQMLLYKNVLFKQFILAYFWSLSGTKQTIYINMWVSTTGL